ncbi:MAG TPA: Panacea domain-containing protein [Candidatus Wujingus californicus]|uniref:Panacea domain-containing protein n=1 Tax=Candidatus Wujingus californicus TaxID=3367618 RepID=UPI001D237C39|nr:SocA family protein [Planctomycetota bacterium]MDO8131201.1 Panacea domain-containing protein [Candidatus Brocadiales bacterium]
MNIKNDQIIKYIVERLSGKLGRIHLMKLIYLADYHARRLFGEPISMFKYHWWQFGPFDKEFYDCVKRLCNTYIREEEVCFPSCKGYVFHDTPNRMEYKSLAEHEIYMLEFVIRTYGKVNLQILLEEVVYKTETMEELIKKDAYGDNLPMEMVDNLDKSLYDGLDPKDIIKGEKAIQLGKVRSLEEALHALQGSHI